jgi:ribose transport system permease protein
MDAIVVIAGIIGAILGGVITPLIFYAKGHNLWAGIAIGLFFGLVGGLVLLIPLWLFIWFLGHRLAAATLPPSGEQAANDLSPHPQLFDLTIIMKILPLLACLGLFAYFASTEEIFTTSRNWTNLLSTATIIGYTALGITLVMLGGEIDLSVIGLVAMAGYAFAHIANETDSILAGIIAALGVGLGVGILNGGLVGLAGIRGYLVTLLAGIVLVSLTLEATNGTPLRFQVEGLEDIWSEVEGIPVFFLVLVVLALLLEVLIFLTPYGRHMKASPVGIAQLHPEDFSKAWIICISYILSGLLTSFAGVLLVSRLRIFQPTAGSDWLPILGAVIIGGTSPFGRRGWVIGTIVGVLFVAMLQNGFIISGSTPFTEEIVLGLVVGVTVVWHAILAGKTVRHKQPAA